MKSVKITRALISVYDKNGVADFAKFLSSKGVEIISTSKTANLIEEKGSPVTKIEKVTDFPEILGGRVKTLHPNIFAGILARREVEGDLKSLDDLKIKSIDLVVVNLYPFVETIRKPGVTLAEAIENIDIGGPSMVRAAAKNHKDVVIITKPEDYSSIMEEMEKSNGEISYETRMKLAVKAFDLTHSYDTHIFNYLASLDENKSESGESLPSNMELNLSKESSLRYGENPHQKAALYSVSGWDFKNSLAGAKPLQGKEMSFNNLIDAQGAINIARDIKGKFVTAIIKHTNPCGVGRSEKSLIDSYKLALECDPVSAFGGIVCVNHPIDGELATEIKKLFTEVIIAPDYTPDALKLFSKKKNLRLIKLSPDKSLCDKDIKFVDGGALMQDMDVEHNDIQNAKVVTSTKPTDEEMSNLQFAMNICKNVKSNGIVIANEKQSIGVGAGQTSRVDSCNIAIMKSRISTKNSVLASDAFFPFRDSIDLVAKQGIKAIIQPGGSLRDQEVIDACDEHGIAMIFTGLRHFKH